MINQPQLMAERSNLSIWTTTRGYSIVLEWMERFSLGTIRTVFSLKVVK